MNSYAKRGATLFAMTLAAVASSSLQAQQPLPGQRPQVLPAPAAKGGAQREAATAGDAGLRQRIEQLEEQLVDMQVVMGTLESLARGATSPAAGGRSTAGAAAAFNAADAGRLDGLETQIQALAAQLESLQEQVKALGGRSGALSSPTSTAASDLPPVGRPARPYEPGSSSERTGFGSVTVSPGGSGQRDDIDHLLNPQGSAQPYPGAPAGSRVSAAPPLGGPEESDVAPKQAYETAYGYLLQRDYGAAEAGFEDFLKRFPNDPLAGNAQYWLGESLYVRGQYRSAAGAFLKGYQNHGRSSKAAESLLKLAMSLQRLGQKDAACSSFNELATKYPGAPAHVKTSAQTEKQRAGC